MAIDLVELQERMPPKQKMTFEEFLDWCDEDTLAEWVDGDIIMTSPASVPHQDLGSLLEGILRIFVEVHDLGKVLRAPFLMKLETRPSGREPDLLFVSKKRLPRLKNTYLDGAADMVVEIISPESISRDRGEKFVEYEQAGIAEYWLLDPDRKRAEFYQLGKNKLYQVAPTDAHGVYRSKVVKGFWLREAWLWQEPLPSALDLLRELNLV